jgi:hypothetical protein
MDRVNPTLLVDFPPAVLTLSASKTPAWEGALQVVTEWKEDRTVIYIPTPAGIVNILAEGTTRKIDYTPLEGQSTSIPMDKLKDLEKLHGLVCRSLRMLYFYSYVEGIFRFTIYATTIVGLLALATYSVSVYSKSFSLSCRTVAVCCLVLFGVSLYGGYEINQKYQSLASNYLNVLIKMMNIALKSSIKINEGRLLPGLKDSDIAAPIREEIKKKFRET